MTWRRRQLTGLLRDLRARLEQEGLSTKISLSPGPFRQAYNLWLQDWELWALGELIDELVVQNYAYSVNGFARDLDQPALRKARDWRIPTQIGILAGFGKRTTSMAIWSRRCVWPVNAVRRDLLLLGGPLGRHVPENKRQQRFRAFRQLGQED